MLVLWNILSRGYLGKVIVEKDIFKTLCIFQRGNFTFLFSIIFWYSQKYEERLCNEIHKMNSLDKYLKVF